MPYQIVLFYLNYETRKDEISEFFNVLKKSITIKTWKNLREKEKLYYLFNKIEYFNILIKQKELSKDKLESMIENKNKELKEIQEKIHEKEKSLNQSGEVPTNKESNFNLF